MTVVSRETSTYHVIELERFKMSNNNVVIQEKINLSKSLNNEVLDVFTCLRASVIWSLIY